MNLLPHSLCVKENLIDYIVACLEVRGFTFILTDTVQVGDSDCFWALNFPGYSFTRATFQKYVEQISVIIY